jgi:DNA polymerase-3 subunit gamma/tau
MCAQVLLPGASTGEKALAARLERMERRLDGLGSEELSAGSAATDPRSATMTAPPVERRPAAPAPEAAPARETPRAREAAAAGETRTAPEALATPNAPAGPDALAPSADGRGTAQTRVAPAQQTTGRGARAQETAGLGARAQETAGQGAGGRETAAREAPARTAPPVRPGVADVDTLRQRWPDVLEAVKSERRVAWMLLNDASVDSLEGGVLIVAFAKEGQAKGFTASGHDQVLIGVLATMLGLNVRVRAVVGTVSGSHSAPPGPAGSAPRAAAGGRATGPGAARPGATGSEGARSGGAGPGDGTDRPSGVADRPGGSADRPGATGGMQDNAGTQPGGFQAHPGQGGSGGRSGAGGATAGRASSPPRSAEPRSGGGTAAPAPAGLAEEWPDDAGPADGGAGPTGMELIERQLGGTIIEEIDEP